MTATAPTIRPLSDQERGWLAGLLEGEGCFDTTGPAGNPRVRVKMTDLDIIMRAAHMMSTTYYGDPGGISRGNKMAWVAQVTGARAAWIMRELLPLLGERRTDKVTGILTAYDARGRRPLTIVRETATVAA